jgi:hypothetical protein
VFLFKNIKKKLKNLFLISIHQKNFKIKKIYMNLKQRKNIKNLFKKKHFKTQK